MENVGLRWAKRNHSCDRMTPGLPSDAMHPCFLFSGFMSGRREQQLSTLRHLSIFAPVAQDHGLRLQFQRVRTRKGMQKRRSIYFSASLASLHEKRESCCQSTCVALPGALFPVIHPHMVRQLLVPCSGIHLLTSSPASSSAEAVR